MDCPPWVPTSAWPHLEAALERQPAHAADALVDLEASTAGWDVECQLALLERFTAAAAAGIPLPAAFIYALTGVLEKRHE